MAPAGTTYPIPLRVFDIDDQTWIIRGSPFHWSSRRTLFSPETHPIVYSRPIANHSIRGLPRRKLLPNRRSLLPQRRRSKDLRSTQRRSTSSKLWKESTCSSSSPGTSACSSSRPCASPKLFRSSCLYHSSRPDLCRPSTLR